MLWLNIIEIPIPIFFQMHLTVPQVLQLVKQSNMEYLVLRVFYLFL